jgi:hypothetical protein
MVSPSSKEFCVGRDCTGSGHEAVAQNLGERRGLRCTNLEQFSIDSDARTIFLCDSFNA